MSIRRLSWAFGLLLVVVSFYSVPALAGTDRVGHVVVKDQYIGGHCWLPTWNYYCEPNPGVIRGLINLIGEERARELGFRKRFFTRRTYSVPVVTNASVCARARAWMDAYRKAGKPKLYGWIGAMSFDLAPAVIGAVLENAGTYFVEIDGVTIGDQQDTETGTHLQLFLRPDRVARGGLDGLCH